MKGDEGPKYPEQNRGFRGLPDISVILKRCLHDGPKEAVFLHYRRKPYIRSQVMEVKNAWGCSEGLYLVVDSHNV